MLEDPVARCYFSTRPRSALSRAARASYASGTVVASALSAKRLMSGGFRYCRDLASDGDSGSQGCPY